jgi:hypothetical protein
MHHLTDPRLTTKTLIRASLTLAAAAAVLATSAAGAGAASIRNQAGDISAARSRAQTVGAAAAAHPTPRVPSGYRKATASERRAMNKAKGLKLTRRYGWFRGRIDPKYAFVCGYRDGYPTGVGIVKQGRGWRTWEMDSGSLQSYQYYCAG